MASQDDSEETDWLLPFWPGAIEAIPTKGDMLVIGFLEGDPHRGYYGWHPTSNAQNRPTEAMAFGTTTWGMVNYLVDQFNQLRTDFNAHTHQVAGTGTTCVNGSPWTGTATAAAPSATGAAPANKGKASDGSVVSSKATSEIVLSGKLKLR